MKKCDKVQHQNPVSLSVNLVVTWVRSLSENSLTVVHFCAISYTKKCYAKISLYGTISTLDCCLGGFKEVGGDKQWTG